MSFPREQNLFCVIAFSTKHWLNNAKVLLEVEKQEAVKDSVEWMDLSRVQSFGMNESKLGAIMLHYAIYLFFFFQNK